MNPKLQQKIELIILTLLILLQVTYFFGILPEDLDFIKKFISWAAIGYLFIKASPSNILFGHKKPRFDLAIILTYFLFIVKDLIEYARVAIEETIIFHKPYSFLLSNAVLIEKNFFYLGAILLLFISLYMALKFEIKKPSFMAVLHETGIPPKKISKFTLRFISIFLVLVAFFIIIFNLAIEWLSIALEAPLTVIAILLYLFVVIRYHREFHTQHFIYKIGHAGEKFYEDFIKMFHYKKTLYLGVMGLLALHLLTDIGNFIIPYITGLKYPLYFAQLGPGHTPLISLLIQDLPSIQGIGTIALTLTYLFNAIAMLFLLLLPALVWYRFFKGRPLHASRTSLALVFSSLLTFSLTPAFFIKKISLEGLAGVDIRTQSILSSHSVIDFLIRDKITAITIVAALSILLGSIIWLMEYNKKIKKDTFIIAVLMGMIFFAFYIYSYFISLYQYYINTIIFLLSSSEFLIAFYFVLFAMLTIVFYIGGYLFFIYEVFKRHFFRE